MKIQIRRNVFETNSSSVHSLTMCTKEQFELWEQGKVYTYDDWHEELVPRTNDMDAERIIDTYNEFKNKKGTEYDLFMHNLKAPGGQEIVVFGYYGSDY